MKPKLILFDFDGTLANTLPISLHIEKTLEKKYGYPHLGKFQKKYRETSFSQILKEKLHLNIFQMFIFFKRFSNLLEKEFTSIQVFPQVIPVIKELSKNYTLGILSTNISKHPKKNIEKILKKYNIEDCFSCIETASFFRGKSAALKKISKKLSLKPSEIIYVGDEINDIKACKKNKIPILSVSWGFHDKNYLQQHNAEKIIDSPKQLLKYLNH
jgi:phosphoglycolate phosphatase-like HAD superfamily hydrolase